MIPKISKVLVLGGGSAGFLAALTIKTKVPDIDVEVIHSPEIGIIGVGEATTTYVPTFLHGYLNLDLAEFYTQVNPAWKLGIRFLWGPRPSFNYSFAYQCNTQYTGLKHPTSFYCHENFEDASLGSSLMSANRAFHQGPNGLPKIGRNAAYHLENAAFVAFLERQARKLGVIVREDTVKEVEQSEAGVAALQMASGTTAAADLFVDCSGFRSLLLGQTLKEAYVSFKSSLFCDRAIVGGWDRENEPIMPFTVAETMNAGWCWNIDHEHRIHRGYVHSSAFLSEDEATREFLAKCPKATKTGVVKFSSGRYENFWVKNVVAIGNAGAFVEPLESTGLSGTAEASRLLAELLRATPMRRVTDSMMGLYNKSTRRSWDAIRGFLALHYRFNRRLDTPFWRACLADADLAAAGPIVEFYRENGPSLICTDALIDRNDQFKLEGHWALLVGQQVPYNNPFVIDEGEARAWQEIRASNRRVASYALTAEQALAAIRRPEWKWNNQFYYDSPGQAPSVR